MKVILITLFLNYELFVCKTVHKVHKQTQGTNFHFRGQPQFKRGHKVFRTEDKVLYRRRDFPEYDVTGVFWGGQTDLERMPKPYTTSTFLPPLEREEPVLTLAPTPGEDEEPRTMPPTPGEDEEPITMPPTPEDELESPEQIDDNTWPYLRPPSTEPTDTVYTNYPGYPYEPPPFLDSVIKDRDKDNYIKLTPQPTQSYQRPPDVIYDYTNTEPGPTNDGITNHTYYVSIPLNTNKPSEYTINLEAFPSSVPALPPDIDSMYTLKPEPNIGTWSTPTTTTTTSTPSTTIKPLWKVVQRNVGRSNLNSNVTISEKDMSNVKKWFSKVTAGTPVQKWFSSWNGLTTGPQMSTLSKSQIWLQKIKDLGIPVHRDNPVDYKLSTATRATASFILKTDSHDILRKTPEYNPLTSTTIPTGSPGTPGNVLYEDIVTFATPAPSLRQVYFKMMEDRNEGFLTIFLQEIFRITSEKDKRLVKELLMEVEPHINTWYDTDQLKWFGQPLADTIVKLSRFLSISEINNIRSYSSMLYHMLQTRKTAVAVDLNSIIEYADLLYTDGEGWELFDAIMEYEQYPNGTRNAKQLCEFIFDCFMRPYRRLSHLERGQTLFNSINTALKNKFLTRRLNGILFRIDPRTTTNGIKSKYLQEEYKRSRRNKKRTNEKKEVADDVINHFSSRLNNIKFAKSTKKYIKEVKTSVINNYYILTATKTNNKAVRYKVNYNKIKETTINYKNLLFGNIFDDQKESILYADSRLDRNPYFNDFDDVKHDTASNKYLATNRKEIRKKREILN
ncbi:unnamed protein product [Spodoptera littoralis]|uniref:Uncharacterized protein n=1 Tax=Spodoptera littoralis TaxID=7109 RepID=A0A9P0N7H4_SPOLI|nr:unnamed protein product [Spodoptera littoralis]CAH1642636.1 unnamed protein product [Spodoptera littoralis]